MNITPAGLLYGSRLPSICGAIVRGKPPAG